MNRRKKAILGGMAAGIILIGGCLVYHNYSNRIYTKCVVEAGTEVVLEDFLKNPKVKAQFLQGFEEIDTTKPGTYSLKIKSGIFTYDCLLTVEDTVPPKGETKPVYSEIEKPVEPDSFFTQIEDVTEVTVAYETEPDYTQYGEQEVSLVLEDTSGNTAQYEETLIIRSVCHEVTMEAGTALPDISAFLLEEKQNAVFVTDMSQIDSNQLQDWNLVIRADGMDYDCVLHIVDTTAPVLEVKNVDNYLDCDLAVEDFVESCTDITDVSLEFMSAPDTGRLGEQQITIRATDVVGNVTEKTAKLILKQDTEAPVFSGISEIVVYQGDSISYRRGVSVTDNSGASISFTVDSSKVNPNEEGEYPVTYIAVDKAGNETRQETKVTVCHRVTSEEEIYELADLVLAQIFTDGMTEREKLSAIYEWVYWNVDYISTSPKDDWRQGAYEGFVNHKGDCFVYFSTAKALLNRAGIKNMDIEKIPIGIKHYWNLVDIGEGWYHFDTCPRDQLPVKFCYVTDAELMAFSNEHYGSHDYDRSKYPQIN